MKNKLFRLKDKTVSVMGGKYYSFKITGTLKKNEEKMTVIVDVKTYISFTEDDIDTVTIEDLNGHIITLK